MIRQVSNAFASRAEYLLEVLEVPQLSESQVIMIMSTKACRLHTCLQISSIKDPLSMNSETRNVSLLSYNSELAETLSTNVSIKEKDLKLVTELHLTVMCLAAMEGGGQLRFTEAMAAIFSSPNQLSRRTLFWEAGRLTCSTDWIKVCVFTENNSHPSATHICISQNLWLRRRL